MLQKDLVLCGCGCMLDTDTKTRMTPNQIFWRHSEFVSPAASALWECSVATRVSGLSFGKAKFKSRMNSLNSQGLTSLSNLSHGMVDVRTNWGTNDVKCPGHLRRRASGGLQTRASL